MAAKEYAYYLEGSQIAIVEKDVSFDNDIDNKDYGPGASSQRWKSPQDDIDLGLHVKYVYSPTFKVYGTPATYINSAYQHTATDGAKYIAFADAASPYTSVILDNSHHMYIKNTGYLDGLYPIKEVVSVMGTNNVIVTNTKVPANLADILPTTMSGGLLDTGLDASKMWNNNGGGLEIMQDEDYEIDLPIYLQKALIYYIKARLAEDAGELKLREYSMREFKKMIEKHESSRISGLRITVPSSHAIR